MFVVLVLCFFGQTALVYADQRTGVRLEEEARRGAQVFHEHNCQACHQIYGFGGFLGPDLTNAASRHGVLGLRTRLEYVLTHGPGQMPVIDMSVTDVRALEAWLGELDRTGVGQVRIDAADATFEAATSGRITRANASVQRGWEVFNKRACGSCHTPFRTTPIGAPDLTNVVMRLEPDALDLILSDGRPPRMPAPTPAFSEGERVDVAAFFTWVSADRARLQSDLRAARQFDWWALPWWEYE